MGKRLFLFFSIILCFALAASAASKRFTLVIDAGHGGNDAGALGAFSKEKNINLNVALSFGRYVESNCPDVKVIYTRKNDVFVPLHERANIANRNKADLFVSIHTNALPGGKIARGLETYTLGMHRASDNLDVAKRENSVILVEKDYKQHYEGFDPNSAESYIIFEFLQDYNMAKSVDMAKYVQRRVCATANRPDKGVKQAGFLVLRETSMPSCLIELGFITTTDEEQFLNTQSGIDDMGRGIYLAFLDYKEKYYKGITVPYQSETKTSMDIPTIVTPQDEETGKERKESRKRKDKDKARQASSNVQEEKNATETKNEPDAMSKKPVQDENTDEPVFKVQIVTSSRNLRPGSQQFKGVADVDCYQENDLYKYTCGSSTNYGEIYQLRKSLLEKFPEAFIVAFKNGQRTDVVQAIKEYRQNKKKAGRK